MENETSKRSYIGVIALVISFCALLASQFKPQFYRIFDKPDLEIYLNKDVTFYHYFGHFTCSTDIQIFNQGDALGVVKKILFYICSKEGNEFNKVVSVIEQQNISRHDDDYRLPIFNILIQPNSTFENLVWAHEELTKFQTDKIEKFKEKVRKDLLNKANYNSYTNKNDQDNDGDIGLESTPIENNSIPRIDGNIEKEIKDYINENLENFGPGNYYLTLLVVGNNNNLYPITKAYTFTVFDSDIQYFNRNTDEYSKGGNGIYYSMNPYPQTSFNTKLSEITDADEIEKLVSKSKNYW